MLMKNSRTYRFRTSPILATLIQTFVKRSKMTMEEVVWDELGRREMFEESEVVRETVSDRQKEMSRGFGVIEEIPRNQQKTRTTLHEAHEMGRRGEDTNVRDAEVGRTRRRTENRTGRKRENHKTQTAGMGCGEEQK